MGVCMSVRLLVSAPSWAAARYYHAKPTRPATLLARIAFNGGYARFTGRHQAAELGVLSRAPGPEASLWALVLGARRAPESGQRRVRLSARLPEVSEGPLERGG